MAASPIPFSTSTAAPGVSNPLSTNPTGALGGSSSSSGVPIIPNSGTSLGNSLIGQTGTSIGSMDELSNIYGAGVGSYLNNLLSTGGINIGLTNQVNAADINAMQPGINQGSANLAALLGAQGVSGNSSTNALAQSNYAAQVAGQENSLINQSYMNEYNQGQGLIQSILGNLMGGAQTYTADQNNWMDYLTGALNIGESGLGIAELTKLLGQ